MDISGKKYFRQELRLASGCICLFDTLLVESQASYLRFEQGQ